MKPRPQQSGTARHAQGVVVAQDVALDAAARLFRTKGYGTTTVRQIAEAAGMLPGSLHYRYPTKESLLLALAARAVDRAIAAIRAATATSEDATARLRLAARAYVRLLLTGDDAPVLLHEWRALVGAPGRELRAHVRRFEVFLDEFVADAIAAGGFRPDIDVTLARRFGFGALNWATVWYSPDDGISSDAIADTFFAFMAYGLVAEGSRPVDIDVLFRTLVAQSTPSARPAATPRAAPAAAPRGPRRGGGRSGQRK